MLGSNGLIIQDKEVVQEVLNIFNDACLTRHKHSKHEYEFSCFTGKAKVSINTMFKSISFYEKRENCEGNYFSYHHCSFEKFLSLVDKSIAKKLIWHLDKLRGIK